jgi:hypothetical protein
MTSTTHRALQSTRGLGSWLVLGLLAGAALTIGGRATAQDELPTVAIVSTDELAEIVGPIALYPDDLVGLVLPASTYPLQVVQAARLLEDRKSNPNLQPGEDWDDSVVALLNYPEVVALLNDDLDWTYDLGAAVLNQRADVLDAIQSFRDRAYTAGNLQSDDRQTVSRDEGAIAIKPANPQVIYVPYYEPERVVVYQSAPVYHYYPWRYPVYYYPYPAGYVFDTGFFWGVRSWFSIGWNTHYVHVYDYGYRRHPYFGWRYYDPWYVRNTYVNVNVNRGYTWEPRHRYGGRPVVRGYEGRVYTSRDAPRVNRGTASSAYRSRSTEGAARSDPRINPVPGSAYRSRSSEGNARTVAPTRVAPRGDPRVSPGNTASGARQRSAAVPGTAREPVYRGGRTAPSAGAMPRESARSADPRNAPRQAPASRAPSARSADPRNAPAARAPTARQPSAAPRSNGSNSYRGADGGGYRGGSAGGATRGGNVGQSRGAQQQAARGGERRSAAR